MEGTGTSRTTVRGITSEDVVGALPGLLRYAELLTRDPHDAQDLVQDTVERALAHGAGFRGDSSATTWLHRTMYHRHVDLARRRTPVPTEDDTLVDVVEAAWQDSRYTVDADVVVSRAETRDRLREALIHLPDILRSAVLLHDLVGLSTAEIAEVHGIGVPAAKQRLRRGRAMVVSLLADQGAPAPDPEVPMRCADARALVGDYLDDELTARRRLLLERHLARCPTCPGLFAGIVGVIAAVGGLRDPESVVPVDLARRLRGEPGQPGSS
ncbi:MAG: RNA polymerase sigma factor [Micrococcales bacterium]|nr:RNA polymerase sigma factor [Micrococcales bacterium]